MSARPVMRAASGGVTRHRAQTFVIFMVLLVSTASATLGLALLATASGPFGHAFAAQHGADVAVGVSSARASDAQLAATRRLPGVTAAAGPYGLDTVTLTAGAPSGASGPVTSSQSVSLPDSVVIGRASPGGPLDDLTLQSGHWPTSRDQIVLSEGQGFFPNLGTQMTVTTAPGKPTLTVVGIANSITNTATAWVLPSEIAALRSPGQPAAAQMLYTFSSAATAAQIRGDVAAIRAALPADSVGAYDSWLTAEQSATGNGSILSPFVDAFALIGLLMAALIVANVVTGAVVASYRRIGVLKSLGFSPAQVIVAYVTRVGVPAVVGTVVGLVAGNVLAIPVLRKSAQSFDVGSQTIPVWVEVVTPLVMIGVVALTAFVPALRAGRLSAVQAIAMGQAPRQGRGYAAHRLASRLRLPRPVTIGLAAPFARPARTIGTLAAIMFGVTAVVYAVGLDASLSRAEQGQSLAATAPVQIGLANGNGILPGSSQDKAIATALAGQRGTLHFAGVDYTPISIAGLATQAQGQVFLGNSAWAGYELISGHWFGRPGQVVVNTAYLTQTGLSVGDATTISAGGKPETVRISGEIFVPGNSPALMTSWQTLEASAVPRLSIAQYWVGLRTGVNVNSYVASVQQSLGGQYTANGPQGGGQFYLIADSLIAMLTLMMAVVAGLGVLNTVLLGTRDRVRDLGVFKAVGMTPRQTITMVMCWVVGPAIAAAVIAVPIALRLHSATITAMGNAAYTALPASLQDVYHPAEILLLAASGLVIAVFGALLPASWAARARTATALRAE
jgi:putative ABC transport system permease protein